jgi:hypothetical protein
MKLDSEDPRLTKHERKLLREVCVRLQALEPRPRQPLPPEYAQAIEETFGACCEGDLTQRGQP